MNWKTYPKYIIRTNYAFSKPILKKENIQKSNLAHWSLSIKESLRLFKHPKPFWNNKLYIKPKDAKIS